MGRFEVYFKKGDTWKNYSPQVPPPRTSKGATWDGDQQQQKELGGSTTEWELARTRQHAESLPVCVITKTTRCVSSCHHAAGKEIEMERD